MMNSEHGSYWSHPSLRWCSRLVSDCGDSRSWGRFCSADRDTDTTVNPTKVFRHNGVFFLSFFLFLKLLAARTLAVSFCQIRMNHRVWKTTPPPPRLSSPERSWPLSPCTDYSCYLIIRLDPPHSQQRSAVPPLTQLPPHCARLWKGVKQNKEGPLKYVATGT